MANPLYQAGIKHTEKTVEQLYKTQYYVYEKPRMLLRMAFGFILVLIAAFTSLLLWIKAVFLLFGAWFLVSRDFPAAVRADRAISERKAKLPSMEYTFHTDTLHLILAPGEERSYTLYDDDGVSNDFRKGIYRKTEISMSGESVVKVAFRSEGEYTDFVETVTVEMIRKDRSPFWITLGNEKLEHFLNRRKFNMAEKGWYYSQSKRAVLVKYPNPKRNVTLTVSFEDFDLIGM